MDTFPELPNIEHPNKVDGEKPQGNGLRNLRISRGDGFRPFFGGYEPTYKSWVAKDDAPSRSNTYTPII